MRYHDDTAPLISYINSTVPQFIAPIEDILWVAWKEGKDAPNGLESIWNDLFGLSLYFANIDNDFNIAEMDFFRDVHNIFQPNNSGIDLSSRDLLGIYKNISNENTFISKKLIYPLSIKILELYDQQHGTQLSDAAKAFFFRYVNAFVKADGRVTREEIEGIETFKSLLYSPLPEASIADDAPIAQQANSVKTEQTLEAQLEKLNSLIGLENVKRDVQELVNFLKVQQMREAHGMAVTPVSKHLVFYGNPGTGKTTIARILAEVYKSMNILTKGHLIETDRAGLVAGFVGQTAIKVHEVVNRAIGGILFIDEAYTLTGENADFGSEAVDTLLKLMEDNRDNLIVIVAGYTDKMNTFLASNPGLKSRFNKFLHFEDYTPEQLQEIFAHFANSSGFKITPEAKMKLIQTFEKLSANKDNSFGNGRLARNIFESTVSNQANRIVHLPEINEHILSTIEASDIADHYEIRN